MPLRPHISPFLPVLLFCVVLASCGSGKKSTQKSFPVSAVNDTPGADTTGLPVNHYFNIEMKPDNTVWYQPVAPVIRSRPLKVEIPVKENLSVAIRQFEEMYPGIKKAFFIKGHKDAPYALFESVVQALKENNIYNYHLSTSNDQ